ncbi:MAG: YchF/TatD family DNA exonuclease [Candidatus Omnitrophica bacterium]|nr:YchF/TatD family DNA exonuclease [Candidatus Omnitrophota bacterium]
MMLIDTHCHLDFDKFDNDRELVIERARAEGVARIINIGSTIEGSKRSVDLAERYDCIYASVGIHPHDSARVTDAAIAELKAMAKNKKVVAIGEVGLDYYHNLAPKDVQLGAFKRFIRLSDELDLPLVLHARDANRELLDMLKAERGKSIKGVMHCFSGDADILKECLDIGLYISFTCNLTFKNAEALRETAAYMPVERLLLETDAPYLAPQELRGERNEPSNLKFLVDVWSRILKLSRADIERITTHNAKNLFGLGLAEDDSAKIAYEIRDSLYLNITNRCTNACDFCVRNQTSFVKGHNLRLEKEPSAEEIISAIGDPKRYKEIVFCGYGEPTMRLDVVKKVSGEVKRLGGSVRMVTNGHGDLINSRPIAGELLGMVDRISVSLNTDSEHSYRNVCKPQFGSLTYKHVIDFIKDCVKCGIKVEATCLDLPGVDVRKCEEMAKSLGATFRLRSLGVVG